MNYYSLAEVPRKSFFELDLSLKWDRLADRDRLLSLLTVPDLLLFLLLDPLALRTLCCDADFSILFGADLFSLSSHSCDC